MFHLKEWNVHNSIWVLLGYLLNRVVTGEWNEASKGQGEGVKHLSSCIQPRHWVRQLGHLRHHTHRFKDIQHWYFNSMRDLKQQLNKNTNHVKLTVLEEFQQIGQYFCPTYFFLIKENLSELFMHVFWKLMKMLCIADSCHACFQKRCLALIMVIQRSAYGRLSLF